MNRENSQSGETRSSRGGHRLRRIGVLIMAVAALASLVALFPTEAPRTPSGTASFLGAGSGGDGFRRVTEPRALSFPADHGPHLGFQTEWWYYVGNLRGNTGRRFGYQLTFFRRGIIPSAQEQPRESSWAADQVYMAHLAITDVKSGAFKSFERFARGALGLAGARAEPYTIWVGDWSARGTAAEASLLAAHADGWGISLQLQAEEDPILHGDRGYSRKGPQAGDASIYYSFTRVRTTGKVDVAGQSFQVDGSSWMDHEWSTSALSSEQVGWDWFSLQLDDGAELMLFQLRRRDGEIDPRSSGTYVDGEGRVVPLQVGDFQINSLAVWRSPGSGAAYPARWRILVPSLGLSVVLTPLVKDQELRLSYTYWEGEIAVTGEGDSPSGVGYVELTGYATSIEGLY
jgi:predicted secreted hydrolase